MESSMFNTNQLLGYPPQARLLILNADDFGMCHAINEGTIQAIRAGAVSSCTVMMPCPWALHALHWLRQNPEVPFGVHLTAVSEPAVYRWKPLTSAEKIPSLVDEAGYFYNEACIPEFLGQVNLAELEIEFRAQIETVLQTGLRPTHLDSHCLIHTRREDIFDMTVGLASKYSLALRVSTPGFIKKLQDQGYPTPHTDVLDSYRVATDDKPAYYFEALRRLPPGLTEWAVHPAMDTAELRAISDSWHVRRADFEFLTSPQTRQILEQEGIILLSYQPLQAVWPRRNIDKRLY
jgi:hypothetical protein